MINPQPKDLVALADVVANGITDYAENTGLTPHELIQVIVLVERMLTRVFPGPECVARAAVLEGHAVFDALTTPACANEGN